LPPTEALASTVSWSKLTPPLVDRAAWIFAGLVPKSA
jgi:hypothetical protein